jgi:Raf kinase inhibitor-like YbhB/YbcL family protein
MRSIAVGAVTLAAAVLPAALAGCGGGEKSAGGGLLPAHTTLGLSSSAFLNGSSIPARYTCDGEEVSPPLTWTRVPVRATSLALLVEDRDAPGGAFVHWSAYDLPRGSSGIGAGRLPSGSAEGQNSFGRTGYGGPCPPKGDPDHHYVFSVYALDDQPGLPPGATPAAVRAAIAGHAIATGTLTGLYRR